MRLGLHANGQAEAGRRFWTGSRNGIYDGINDRVVCECALAHVVWKRGCFVICDGEDGGVKRAKCSTPLSYIKFLNTGCSHASSVKLLGRMSLIN